MGAQDDARPLSIRERGGASTDDAERPALAYKGATAKRVGPFLLALMGVASEEVGFCVV